MKLVVYTALVGDCRDQLYPPQQATPDCTYVAFTDRPELLDGPRTLGAWHIVEAPDIQKGRRLSRWLKCNPHVVFPDATHSVWVDATMTPAYRMPVYAGSAADLAEVATFKHRNRVCIYQEARECLYLNKDDPSIISSQMHRYLQAKYGYYLGLWETSVMVRTHTPRVQALNELWWSEISQGSVRDQLSFPYALWRMRLHCARLPGWAVSPPGFVFRSHWQ